MPWAWAPVLGARAGAGSVTLATALWVRANVGGEGGGGGVV